MKQPAGKRLLKLPERLQPWVIGGAVGAGLLLFFAIGFTQLFRQAHVAGIDGIIVSKQWIPRPPETQITIGQAGVHAQRVEGDGILQVRDPIDGKVYDVWVNQSIYAAHTVGQRYYFIRPPSASK